jgi:DNA-binding transcriptional regulator GbsR (MarR family)
MPCPAARPFSCPLRPASTPPFVPAANRPAELAAFEDAVVSFFTDAAEILGVPKSVAAIYGICFASAEPLSFAEIEARLEISKGSVSQGLKLLREVGALRPVAEESARVERYEPDIELRKLVLLYLEQRVSKQLQAGRSRIREIKAALPAGSAGRGVLKDRVSSLEGWHSKSAALLPLIKGALKLS